MAIKTVVITGATSGIGEASAKKFALNGWTTFCLGTKVQSLEELKNWSLSRDLNIIPIKIDLSESRSTENAVRVIGQYTQNIDALVNSAGVCSRTLSSELSNEEWEKIFRVNVTASFSMIRDCLPYLQSSDIKSIVNVSSIAGRVRSKGLSCAYTASKAALIGMTRHLAGELGPKGIRINCICPSQTKTPMLDYALNSNSQQELSKQIPLQRLAQPDEQANVIYFLCGQDASYINGAIIDVNGGII